MTFKLGIHVSWASLICRPPSQSRQQLKFNFDEMKTKSDNRMLEKENWKPPERQTTGISFHRQTFLILGVSSSRIIFVTVENSLFPFPKITWSLSSTVLFHYLCLYTYIFCFLEFLLSFAKRFHLNVITLFARRWRNCMFVSEETHLTWKCYLFHATAQ